MIPEFDKAYVESVLSALDEQDCLFPQFALTKLNNKLKLLGTGGFSAVYEMYDKERPEHLFALKVIGFQRHTLSSVEFRNTSRMQWILCQESKYIMRVLDARELVLVFDDYHNYSQAFLFFLHHQYLPQPKRTKNIYLGNMLPHMDCGLHLNI